MSQPDAGQVKWSTTRPVFIPTLGTVGWQKTNMGRGKPGSKDLDPHQATTLNTLLLDKWTCEGVEARLVSGPLDRGCLDGSRTYMGLLLQVKPRRGKSGDYSSFVRYFCHREWSTQGPVFPLFIQ